jgi:thiosulfate dehydrogenase
LNKNTIFGFIGGILFVIASGGIFLYAGGMPVATKGPPLPFERTIAHIALHAATKNADELKNPFPTDEAHLIRAVHNYVTNCAVCHGIPSSVPTGIANGLFPKPPQLFAKDEGVTDDPIGNIYWKVNNGIRLTGMPGFVGTLSDEQIWSISQLLLDADHLAPNITAAFTHQAFTQ